MSNDDERQRETWRPRTDEFSLSDFSSEALVIHFWATWNARDREMDDILCPIAAQFSDIEFRSLDVDNADYQELCVSAKVLNVPALAFYSTGAHIKTIIGIRQTAEIIREIQSWNDKPQ